MPNAFLNAKTLPPQLPSNDGPETKVDHCARSLAQLPLQRQKDSHDTRAGANITISKGPPQDPRFFYSTTYSTTHNTNLSNSLLSNPINGIHSRDLKIKTTKQRTGYSKNQIAFVQYDKKIDESPDFFIDHPFLTKNSTDYSRPSPPKNYLTNPKAGITPMVDSGFTRLPSFNVTRDNSDKFNDDKETLMKASYPDGQLQFKESRVNKQAILPSVTAYISDEGEIKSIGNPEAVSETERFHKPSITGDEKPWKYTRPAVMRADGYTRSTRPKNPLQVDNGGSAGVGVRAIQPRLLLPTQLEKVKHRDLAEWVHRVDLNADFSFSRFGIVHPPLDLMTSIKNVSTSAGGLAVQLQPPPRIGLKEPTGGVQNNPKFVFIPEPNAAERFLTETAR
ncbi:hypothetical protein HK100_003871, partial [Physocladia obscura]